ncbi:hypothetical protein [Salinarimonas chemoclinalis]|uniref:hypothetical protein n=1 Tax=Salinarimonas chemoclinalis TaxID=3241599 RepID=UPI003558EC08
MFAALTTRLRRTIGDAEPADAMPADDGAMPEALAPEGAPPEPAPLPRPFHVSVAEDGEVLFAQAFEAGSFVVGASPQADIIIPDLDEPEIANVRLETVGSACLVTLTALAPGVSARGRALAEGRPVLFPERAQFTVGVGYRFDIAFTPPKTALVVERSKLPALLVVGGIALGLAGLLVGGGTPDVAPTVAQARTRADAPELLRPAALPAPEDPAVRLAREADALRLAFVSASLVPQLRVSPREDGLVVEGDVTPEERARAMEVIAGFRTRSPTPIELALASDAREADFFETVVLQPEAYLIGSDGRRYGANQQLPSGARIVAIDETSVLLDRDGVRQRVFYGL